MNRQNLNQNLWIEIILILLPIVLGFFIPSNNSFIQNMWQYYVPVTTLISYLFIIYISKSKTNTSDTVNKMSRQSWFLLTLTEYILCTIYILMGLDWKIDVETWTFLFLGLLFIITGNMLPKIEQNNFMGVKVKWSLENRDNWNYTNRLTGKIWVISGFLLLLTSSMFPKLFLLKWFVILVIVFSPFLVSYLYYKKQVRENQYTIDSEWGYSSKNGKKTSILSAVILAFTLIFCAAVFLLGSYKVTLNDQNIQIDAVMYSDSAIPYSQIENIELKKGSIEGSRTFGYGSPMLQMGRYKNSSLGTYTRYTKGKESYILIQAQDGFYVINEKTEEETKDLYAEIKAHIQNFR